jgi:DNA-binding LacI/PurR family transcriptional regulator
MANIRDVAREAGTSIATVSRILSNDSTFEITDKTRKSVLDAAKKLQYTVKAPKKAPKKIHLGCVLALTAEKYSDPFFTSILSAAEEECVSHNALISIVRNYNELENPAVLSEICTFGLMGLILMEDLPEPMLRKLKASIPHIITVDLPITEFNSVGFDNYESNVQVMNCLLDHGYRRIAYIGGSSPGIDFESSPRMAAYREVLFRNKIPYDPSLVFNCKWDLDLCASYATQLFSMDRLPDAVFAGSDTLASVILGAMHKMGLRCPEDIGIIGFNNINMSALMAPPLTTVDVPTKDIGSAAVRRLMDIIHGRDDRIMKITFPTKIILRDSLRDISKTTP